jgi:hypothetical protein
LPQSGNEPFVLAREPAIAIDGVGAGDASRAGLAGQGDVRVLGVITFAIPLDDALDFFARSGHWTPRIPKRRCSRTGCWSRSWCGSPGAYDKEDRCGDASAGIGAVGTQNDEVAGAGGT